MKVIADCLKIVLALIIQIKALTVVLVLQYVLY